MNPLKLLLLLAACHPLTLSAANSEDTQAVADATDNDPLREYFEAGDNRPVNEKSLIADSTDGTDAAAAGAATGAKVVKKKKKKSVDTAAASDGAVVSGHGEQESGAPYMAEVSMDLWYSSENKTQKYTNDSYKIAETNMALDVKYQMILGSFEIGPKISYGSATQKTTKDVTTTTKSSMMGLGLAFTFNMGNIHTSKIVPFIGLDVDRMSSTSSTATEGVDGESKSTDTDTRPGLAVGANFFMGGHVALKPMIQYQMIMGGEHKEEETGTEAVVASVTGSKLMVGMGIGTFF